MNLKMGRGNMLGMLLLMQVMIGCPFQAKALRMNYYIMACPFADQIVRNTVNNALMNDPTLAAGLVRMFFHDCFIEGCDASILLDSEKGNVAEKDSPANLSLRGYELIDNAKEAIENQCPGVVSCADIIAMAARDAVVWAGGPVYDMPMGRMDGKRSKIEDTRNLPSPFLNASELIRTFGLRGFSPQDVVALSGAHTLGAARCSSFKPRLTNTDPTLDSSFAKTLSNTCNVGDSAEQPFDSSRNDFDTNYFVSLQRKSGVLFSDQTLYNTPRTRNIVNFYAMYPAKFFFDFQQAMVRMSMLDVKDYPQGEIRHNCRRIN